MDHNDNDYIIEKILHKGTVHCKVATVSIKQGAFNTTNGNLLGKLIKIELLGYQTSFREILYVVVNY
jgi:hypothetical protein